MRTIATTVLFLVLCFVAEAQTSSQELSVPKGWEKFSKCGFSMLVPKGLKEDTTIKAIDSCIGVFRSRALSLSFDCGIYGSPIDPGSYATDEHVQIDGKKSRVVAYQSGKKGQGAVAAMYMTIGESKWSGAKAIYSLKMFINVRRREQLEDAMFMLRSIRFSKNVQVFYFFS